jgi:HEPN domain-containing protein
MRIFTRKDGFSETMLLHYAVDHLGSAKVLFKRDTRCLDSAGYLCHLGIELVLKTILLNKCHRFPNDHSLSKLCELIERQNVNLNCERDYKDTITMLDGFYDLRYPRPLDPVEIGDGDWDRIENLFEFLILKLPHEIQDKCDKIDHSKKGNRVLMHKKKSVEEMTPQDYR